MSASLRLVGPIALALGLVACHSPSTKLPLEPQAATEDRQEAGGEARDRIEPLPVEAPADLLPADTMGLLEASDPREVLELFAALDQIPQFNAARGEARSQLGVDLFDPNAWPSAGLDPAGPVGVGMFEIDAEAGFVYAKLTDPQAFEAFVERFVNAVGMNERVSAADVGNGRMIRLGDEASVIIREGYAVGVFSDNPERARRDYAATIATIDPRESLARTPGFAWTTQRRTPDDDGLLFLAPEIILSEVARQIDSDDHGVRYAREELDRARANGQPAQVIRDLENQLEAEREWQTRRAAKRSAALELGQRVFGSMGAAFITGDLHPGEISARGGILMPGPSVLRDLFVPVTGESPLLRALDEPLLAGIDGRADIPSMLELIDLFAKADGESLAELNAELQIELGFDVLGQLFPALDGRGGMAVTESKPVKSTKPDAIRKTLGFSGYLGLSDPQAIEALIEGVVRAKRMGGMLKPAKRGPGWTVEVPEWRSLHVRVVGDQLVVSTNAALAGRIDKAKPGRQAALLADPAHPMRGAAATPALRMYQRWRWLALANVNDPWLQDAESMLFDMNSHSTLSPDQAAKVPRSKAFKKKFKELEKVVDELNAYNLEQARADFEQVLEVTDKIGDAGMQVERVSDGLAAQAVWRWAPGGNPIEMGALMFTERVSSDWMEYEKIMSRSYELRDELRVIRDADLDAAIK